MKTFSRLLLIAGVLLVVAAGALRGANFFLARDTAGQKLGALLSRHLPDVDIRFSTARFRLSWRGFWLQARDINITHNGGAKLRAAAADFWFDDEQADIILHRPDIQIALGAAADAKVILPILPTENKRWTVRGDNAILRVRDAAGDEAVTFYNGAFLMIRDDGRLRFNIEDKSANSQTTLIGEVDDKTFHGDIYATLQNWRVAESKKFAKFLGAQNYQQSWDDAAITVWASIGDDINVVGGGHFLSLQIKPSADAKIETSSLRWRARSRFSLFAKKATVVTVAVSVIADGATINKTPAAVWAAGGELTIPFFAKESAWRLSLTAVVGNQDGAATMLAMLAGDGEKITDTRIGGELANVDAAAIRKYLPDGEARQWFATSLQSGAITAADFLLTGDLARFPYPNGEGEVLLTATFEGGQINIADGFPVARGLAGVLVLHNDDLTIGGEGVMSGLTATDVAARIRNFAGEEETFLALDFLFTPAPINHYLSVAKQLPPIAKETAAATKDFTISGEAILTLNVTVPLAAVEKSRVSAILHFFDGQLTAPRLPTLQAASGRLRINNDGARGTVTGKVDDALLTVHLTNDDIILRGALDSQFLLNFAKLSDIPARGTVVFTVHHSRQETVFNSSLTGVEINLPAPLKKQFAKTAPLTIKKTGDGFVADWQNEKNDFHLVYENDGAQKFDLAVNAAAKRPAAGGRVHGGAADINADEWLKIVGDGGDSFLGVQADLTLWNPILLGHRQNALIYHQQKNRRQAVVDGATVAGTVTVDGKNINASLRRLFLSAGDLAVGGGFPRRFAVTADIARVDIGGRKIGRVLINGSPENNDAWRLRRLTATDGDNKLTLGGVIANSGSRLSVSFSGGDLPRLFDNFLLTGVVKGGRATFDGNLYLPAADFDASKLGGGGRLQARDLRYLKSNRGALRLLSIFSFESLLSLGFTELGDEGIILEDIGGQINIFNGVAHFDELRLENDDLIITMAGEANLARESFNIHGRVRPGRRLFRSGSVVTAISTGGTSMLVEFLFGKAFKEPISEIGAYNYTITGDWDNPIYTEIGTTPKPPATPN